MPRIPWVLIGCGMLALGACGTGDDEPAPGFQGSIPGATWSDDRSWAARIDGDYQMLFITTTGSSTCPHVIDGVDHDVENRHLSVTAHQHKPAGGQCTLDLQPHTSFVTIPEPVEPEVEVTIGLEDFYGTITLLPDTSAEEDVADIHSP